jgi:type III secretion protein U
MTEKTEKASNKKLRDARKRGEVAKSKDVTSAAVFAALLAVLWIGAGYFMKAIEAVLEIAIDAPAQVTAGRPWLLLLEQAVRDGSLIVLPVLVAALVAALLAGFAQVRGVFSVEPLQFKPERLNPAEGLKNLFSTRQLFELLKLIVKTAALGFALYVVVQGGFSAALRSVYAQPAAAGLIGWKLVLWLFSVAALVYAVVSVADFGLQVFEYLKRQRMSKEEVKRERRDMDGDPHVRARRRQILRELASGQGGAPLAKASVVLTNPTHVAVALWYERGLTELPVVIAKALDSEALELRRSARGLRVPIVENRPLARQLYAEVGLNETIEEAHFEAVAEVLRWVRGLQTEGEALNT